MKARLTRLLRSAEEFHLEFFVGRWRAAARRSARRESDAFAAMLFLEAVGVETPTSYFTLELYPELVEEFHRWHRRMGQEKFPESGVCC